MKYIKFFLFILCISLGFCSFYFSQARLVVNGAYMVIDNAAYLVVDNPNANAIVRNSGHIISEDEDDNLKWNIGTTVGTYTIPWGYSTTDYLPLTFTKNAGVAAGNIIFSTYRTGTWENSSYLPAVIGNFNNALINDHSEFAVDRFWKMQANAYGTKPDLSNIIFTYADIEHTVASNTISEADLEAWRWDPVTSTWYQYGTDGVANTVANTVTVDNISAASYMDWWNLISNISTALPIEMTEFTASCSNNRVEIHWTTESEINNIMFTIEKSDDGVNFYPIGTLDGSLYSLFPNSYSFYDNSYSSSAIVYYRLKQTDIDGKTAYSDIIANSCASETSDFEIVSIFNNGSDILVFVEFPKTMDVSYFLYDTNGKLIQESQLLNNDGNVLPITFDKRNLLVGIYYLSFFNKETLVKTVKIPINK
ncbi:MAG: hypothetical protein HYU67_05990 [Flavobacteriia bacterium]|nr:hypothetical protein [Flavobacteriia bacterium]